jgi:pimeloyl-ACP methyl ester carboxylesterase
LRAVRRALGVEKLTLFGISYGTKLALAYARAHPDHVERIALDSVLEPDDPDAFGLLEEVSRVPGAVAAEVLRGRLAAAGIRATLSRDGPTYRILVFPDDLKAARVVLSRGSLG